MNESSSTGGTTTQGRSGCRRSLFGCLIGCGGATLVAVGLLVAFFVWLSRPGPLLEPRQLLDPDTGAYAEWTLRLEDPGTARLVEQTLEQLQRLQPTGTPLPLLDEWQRRRNERKMRELFPFVVAWSLHTPEAGEPDHLFSFSMERLGNRVVLMDWVLGWFLGRTGEIEIVRHGDEKIYRIRDGGAAFFIRRSDIFVTTDLETARRAVDRLRFPLQGTERGALAARLDELPQDRPLRGAVSNRHDEVETVLGWLVRGGRAAALEGWSWDAVGGMTLSGGFTESSSFEVELTLNVDDPSWGASHGDALAAALAEGLGEEGALPIAAAAEVGQDRLVVRLTVEDLPGLLEEKIGRLEELQRRGVNERVPR